ncbi:MAG: signal peptide peptidase SppA [Dehalococcoidia bacterium]|nr:signal peptide peptidase SppA [Dehalococcoidia bacterium]
MLIRLPRRPHIGILELHGALGSTIRANTYYQILDRLERSARIGCVLLDIDSPGGSVSASESLYLKVIRLRQKKPVVAFIRGAGASGAYLVACAASRIVAQPGAIVGSIGVISLRPVVGELMQRLGVSVSVNKSGPLKDMGAFYRPSTPEEDAKMQSLVNELFEDMVQRVAEARHRTVAQVREVATGEVFTARRAVNLGLVDELGDFDTALDSAASLGNMPRRVSYVRPPRPARLRLLDRFVGWAMESVEEETATVVGRRLWYM